MNQNAGHKPESNDDDVRPEYDFSRGLRGVHAHRFAKLVSDEALVLGYWQSKGFEVGAFSANELREWKTPDFRLSRGGLEVAFCEVKSFQRDMWLEEEVRKAAPGKLVGGLRPDPIANRISNAIHTAFRQFESVNSDHSLYNFLVLMNHDVHALPIDLDSVITGYYDPLHGCLDETHTKFSEGRIRSEKRQIDLYIWMDISKSGLPEVRRIFFGNPATQKRVGELLGLNSEEIQMITPAA